MVYLNNVLRRNQDQNVARSGLARTFSKLSPLNQEISQRIRLLEADSAEDRAKIDSELKQAQSDLQEWETSKKPKILEQFKKGLTALNLKTQDELAILQPGGTLCAESSEMIWNAENVDLLIGLLDQVQGNLQAAASRICVHVAEQAQADISRLLVDLVGALPQKSEKSISTSIVDRPPMGGNLTVNANMLQRLTTRQIEGSFFEATRTGLYGGMAGVAIASLVGGIVGSVIPVVGTIAGSWVGMTIAGFWGGREAVKLDMTRKLEALKQQADHGLQQAFASAHQSATKEISRLLADIQSEATSTMQKVLNEANADLARRRQEVAQRNQASQKEISARKKLFTALAAEVDSMEKSLFTFRSTLAS